MKSLGFVALVVVVFASLFRIGGAELTNNVTAVSLMILLISLFSDLQKFNFWGLTGEKTNKALKAVEGKDGVSPTTPPKPNKKQVEKAEQGNQPDPTDADPGNFLTIALEIERMIKVAGSILLGSEAGQRILDIIKQLQEKGLLTEDGVKQVEAVHGLRNLLINGKAAEISDETLQTGVSVAWSFYNELKDWLDTP